VNKVETAIRITHLPTNIVVGCQAERSQHKNREIAMKMLRSRLYDLEIQKRQAHTDKLDESKLDISFGSQIRSYVMQPYRMIKDHRTKFSAGDVDRVMDGDIDPFIRSYLMAKRPRPSWMFSSMTMRTPPLAPSARTRSCTQLPFTLQIRPFAAPINSFGLNALILGPCDGTFVR